ncbi:MAG: hypothetical protein WEC75_02170 [Dehalococcoidia bacterium]
MFNLKGAALAVLASAVLSALLVAGLAVDGASGAPTDAQIPDLGDGLNLDLTVPDDTGAAPAPPPASPIEPPAGTPAGTTPTGGDLGDSGAPGALPSAGFGQDSSGGTAFSLFLLVGIAGLAMVSAGATLGVANRRK